MFLDFFCNFGMEKRSKESMKSDNNCGLSSLTNEDIIELKGNDEVKPSKDGGGKNCEKITSERNGKQSSSTTLQSKHTRSELGRELFPTIGSRETRGRTKLPPFRGGRYIPSDGYLYSSWSFDPTEEKSDKSRTDKAKSAERVKSPEETKQPRSTQSASFHGLETKQTRPKLRTRCKSTDCGRLTRQDGIRLNHKMSNYGCSREAGRKKEPRCRSADLSQVSVQDMFNCPNIENLPSQQKDVEKSGKNQCSCKQPTTIPESHQQLSVNESPDNELAKQTLTGVDETANCSKKPDPKASIDIPNRNVSPQNTKNPTNCDGTELGSGVDVSFPNSTLQSGEKIDLQERLPIAKHLPTRKGKDSEARPRLDSFNVRDKIFGKNKPNTQSSPRRSLKNIDKTDSETNGLQNSRPGMDGVYSSASNPKDRKKVSDKLDKTNLENSSAKDVSMSLSRKEQNSPGRKSAEKTKSTSKPSPQRVGKLEQNCNAHHSASIDEKKSSRADLEVDNISSRSVSSEKKNEEKRMMELSKRYTGINQVDSVQSERKIKSDQDTSTPDCKTQENESPVENTTGHIKETIGVGNDVEKKNNDNCFSDDAGNHNISSSQPSEDLTSEINSKNFGNPDALTTTGDTSNNAEDRPRGNVKLQRNYKTKVTKRPSNENKDQHSCLNKSPSEKNRHSELKKNPSDKELPSLNKDVEGKKTSPRRRLSGGIIKYPYEKIGMDCKAKGQSIESSRKLAFERRESYSKQLREKNMRNALLKKKMGLVNKRNGVRLQENSAIAVKIKHVKSRRLLRRNVAYVKREQKEHFSQEHDHDSWVLFTVTLSSSLVGHAVSQGGLDMPDGRDSAEFCKPTRTFISCVLPTHRNVIPKVKIVLVRSPKSNLKRLFLLPVKKLGWSLFDGMVM